MNLEEFTEAINAFWDKGEDKNAALLAGENPDLYSEYARDWMGEDHDKLANEE